MMASHAGLPSATVDDLERKMSDRLVRLRGLLVEGQDLRETAACIHETDLIEREIMRLRPADVPEPDSVKQRICDPWISVSF